MTKLTLHDTPETRQRAREALRLTLGVEMPAKGVTSFADAIVTEAIVNAVLAAMAAPVDEPPVEKAEPEEW